MTTERKDETMSQDMVPESDQAVPAGGPRTASAAKTTRDVDAAIWAQVPTYVRAGGLVLQGLVNRRNDSLELWGPKPEQAAPATAGTAGGTETRPAGPMPGHREERAGIHGDKKRIRI